MDGSNPQAVWQKLLTDIQNKPAFGWVRSLRLDRFENATAYLSLLPGQREMARFFGDRQRTQLAQMIGQLMGRPVKVELVIPAGLVAEGEGDAASPAPGGRSAITAAQRQEVMNLPLVRELMETFDLSLVEVRRQQPAQPQEESDPAQGDDDDGNQDIPRPLEDDMLLDELMEDQE